MDLAGRMSLILEKFGLERKKKKGGPRASNDVFIFNSMYLGLFLRKGMFIGRRYTHALYGLPSLTLQPAPLPSRPATISLVPQGVCCFAQMPSTYRSLPGILFPTLLPVPIPS